MTVAAAVEGVRYWYDETARAFTAPGRPSLPLAPVLDAGYDWSDANPAWGYTSTSDFTKKWPAGVTETDLIMGSGDLWNDLNNTLAPFSSTSRVVVRMPDGKHHLKLMRAIGTTDLDSLYAFGFWFSKLRGFLTNGPDKCTIQLDANSYRDGQIARIEQLPYLTAGGTPLQAGLGRMDGLDPATGLLIAGVTFQAADQQMITAVGQDMPSVVPQPAPHQGLVIYPRSYAKLSYCRFIGAGRAITSSPPGEMGDFSSQYCDIEFDHCEFDGRRAPDIDPARPRRCTTYMGNNEKRMLMEYIHMHHTNVSRYAVNDAATNPPVVNGPYTHRFLKIEHITENHNSDPALNGGNSLGGSTNATLMGYESSGSPITIEDTILQIDNPFTDGGSIQHHIQFTNVGRTPTGTGPLIIRRTEFRNTVVPQLNGYCQTRISPATFWSNYNQYIFIYHKDTGARLSPYVYTGTWPPTAAKLSADGVSSSTHYLVRTT